MRATSFVLLAALAVSSPASAYFVIVLDGDAKLHADFVREEAGVLHVWRGTGVLQIDKARIREVREVDPGVMVDVPKPAAGGLASPPPAETSDVAAAPSIDPREREHQVGREIILGHRDLLFAKLRKESPEELAKRMQELDELKAERAKLLARRPSWERGSPR